jgi:hypothetical protein
MSYSISQRVRMSLLVYLLVGFVNVIHFDAARAQGQVGPIEGSKRTKGSFSQHVIKTAVTRLLNFQIPARGNISLVGTPTSGLPQIRTVSPVGWVQGALLVGLKDWARAADDEEWWAWLQVRLVPCMQSCDLTHA